MFSKPFKPLTIRKPTESFSEPAGPTSSTEPASKRRKVSPSTISESELATPTTSTSHSHSGSNSRPIPIPTSSTSASSRQPLRIIRNAPSPPEPTDESVPVGLESHYSVLWRNFTQKKNKTWTGDGVIAVVNGYATMYDGSGAHLGRTAFSKPLLPGSTLSIGGKDVEVDTCIGKPEFQAVVNQKSSKQPKTVLQHARPVVNESPTLKVPPKPKPSLQDQMRSAIQKEKVADRSNSSKPLPTHQPAKTGAFKQPLKENTILAQGPGETPIPRHDPTAPGAVVFKRLKRAPPGHQLVDVVLDPLIGKRLRDHQREGVKFLYECVMELRHFGGQGCILADDMGLGKTLQTIALLWTLIKQNPVHKAAPVVKKALIVCPVSLIQNWKKEFKKWLGSDRLGVLEFQDPKTTRLSMFDGKIYNVMIIGYERLRMVADDLAEAHGIDIVICDEGHRLKTVKNKSAKAIESLNTTRRVILSGTPIQNDLGEFYAMVNFVNDGCLGSAKAFLKDFENPIMKSRQPNASEEDIERGEEASGELARTTSPFILRRTAEILSEFLPPKTEYVLFCKPTPEQAIVYRNVVRSPMFRSALGSTDTALQFITILKKLCNSPALMQPRQNTDATSATDSLTTLNEMLPPGISRYYHNSLSAKIRLLDVLLQHIHKTTNEKVVLVSNYTSTLNLMENLLASSGLRYSRLDGSVPASKRQSLVDEFNRARPSHLFAFLLSAKAGGVGINLTGASRLVLFDVDWNPATDDQAMARIHRQGQKQHCRIYRFLIKGALEERIWQRQVVKRGLAESILDGKNSSDGGGGGGGTSKKGQATFSQDELRDLFRFDETEGLRTHDLIGCGCKGSGSGVEIADVDSDLAEKPFWEESREESEAEEAADDELPDFTSIVSASQITSEGIEVHERMLSTGRHPKQAHSKRKKNDAELQELMKYAHLDTNGMPGMDEGSAKFARVQDIVDDECLMHLLKQDRDLVAGGVAYLFKKISGSKDLVDPVADGAKVEVKTEEVKPGLFV